VFNYNGAQWYEQFLQVGQLDQALILLGLALIFRMPLCLQCSWCYIYLIFFVTFFTLPFSNLSLVGLAIDLVD